MANYQIDSTALRLGDNTKNANRTKTAVLKRLLKDEVITEEQFKEYNEKWNVIIVKKGWFKTWMEKFTDGESKDYIFKYVKFED